MRVRLDAERFYLENDNPWGIGDADSERYDAYAQLLLRHAYDRDTLLDIGCGMGAFLARFREHFDVLHGVDVSQVAIARGEARYPELSFFRGSAAALPLDELQASYGAVIYSDVINYL